ncbi:YcxB family protein [Solimonas sp. SE-A11]|uniref:YcxB family protein n=1 Tax=Solimonas sp. SE-A11 TaxID=3054954 RepID=UPI00259D2BFB|nr:YcxB family protein [Solimonas sp. SE-A11]
MSTPVTVLPLAARGSLGEADYVAAQFLHLRPPPMVLSLLGLVLVAALIGLALTRSPVLLSTLAVLATYLLLVMPWRARRRYRASPGIAMPMALSVDEQGLHFDRGGRGQLLRWEQIGRWRGTRNLVLLYPVKSGFYLVPASFFARPQDFEAFVELLRQRVGTPH